MKRRFLALHPLLGTKNKPAALHLQQRSPYYWWWAYLRRNADYLACCGRGGTGELAALYADFGDVRTDDFRNWWGGKEQRGSALFGEQPIDVRVGRLATKDEWLDHWSADDVMVVAVNMGIGRRKLQQYFAYLLQKEHKGVRGRPALGKVGSTAKYPLHRNFTTHSLKVMLDEYDAWHRNQQLPSAERKPMWKLCEDLKLVPSAITRAKDSKAELTDKKNVMTVTMSRYLKQARAIVANTARGQFPNSDT